MAGWWDMLILAKKSRGFRSVGTRLLRMVMLGSVLVLTFGRSGRYWEVLGGGMRNFVA